MESQKSWRVFIFCDKRGFNLYCGKYGSSNNSLSMYYLLILRPYSQCLIMRLTRIDTMLKNCFLHIWLTTICLLCSGKLYWKKEYWLVSKHTTRWQLSAVKSVSIDGVQTGILLSHIIIIYYAYLYSYTHYNNNI